MAKTKRGMVRGVAISTFGNIAPVIAGLVTGPILAQSLGVSGRGELAAATAPLLLAIGAVTFGIPESITYHVARGAARVRPLFLRASVILTLAGLLSTFLVVAFADELSGGRPELAELITLASFAIAPGLLVGVARGVAAGHQLWTLIAAEKSVSALLRLVLILVLAIAGQLTPLSATIVIAGTSVVGGIVYLALLRKRPARVGADVEEVPRLLRFGLGLWMGTLAGVLLSRLDQILMVPLSSTYVLGIYAVAVTLSETVLVFNRAVRDVVFSAESAEGQMERLSQASRISTLVTAVGAVGVGLVGVVAIPWLFGAEFKSAVPVMVVLLLGIVLGNPGSIAGAGLSARGKPILRSASLVLAATINVAALIVLVPQWGAMGAAVATLIGNLVAGYANIIWLHLLTKVSMWDFVGFRRRDVSDGYAAIRRVLVRGNRKLPIAVDS